MCLLLHRPSIPLPTATLTSLATPTRSLSPSPTPSNRKRQRKSLSRASPTRAGRYPLAAPPSPEAEKQVDSRVRMSSDGEENEDYFDDDGYDDDGFGQDDAMNSGEPISETPGRTTMRCASICLVFGMAALHYTLFPTPSCSVLAAAMTKSNDCLQVRIRCRNQTCMIL